MTPVPRARGLAAFGVLVGLLGVYLLTSPGRIDFIDGQHRYEVARNWLTLGEPVIEDPVLRALGTAVDPRTGRAYAYYNAAPSLTPMPLMLLARWLGGDDADLDRFAFSLTGAFFGALVPALLVLIYGALGVPPGLSVSAALVFALATHWWPGSVTTFDQNQHAFVLLVTAALAWEAGRRTSLALALAAGIVGGMLITYQEPYALILPAIALAVAASRGEGTTDAARPSSVAIDRRVIVRYVTFGAGCCVGLALFFLYNELRFGALLQPDRYDTRYASHPLAGALSLTLSPGRSALLFSPPLLLVPLGIRALWARAPALCVATAATGAIHFLFVASVPFFAGEWAWGPRYLVVLLPLAGLALPFGMARVRRRSLLAGVVALGVVVQLMAVSLDHQRFYFERNLPPHFWADRPWFYFGHSQLFARPLELITTLRDGVPAEVVLFVPTPRSQLTYAPFGPPRAQLGSEWARRYAVFHVLRPWPMWMTYFEAARRPVPMLPLVAACAALVGLGAAIVAASFRR